MNKALIFQIYSIYLLKPLTIVVTCDACCQLQRMIDF